MTLQEHLQKELFSRCRANPRYSLRAFAKSLSIEPSALSKILSGKRQISPAMKMRLCPRLGLSPQTLKEIEQTPDEAPFEDLTSEAFYAIADWYHYAILELTRIEGFRSEPQWIARMLGIRLVEAKEALKRLERLGMIDRNSTGKIQPTEKNFTIANEAFRASAAREFQRQILKKALEALDQTPIEQRENSGITMAIDPGMLPKAEAMIRQFRRQLMGLLETRPKTEVYQLVVALFPLTQHKASRKARS